MGSMSVLAILAWSFVLSFFFCDLLKKQTWGNSLYTYLDRLCEYVCVRARELFEQGLVSFINWKLILSSMSIRGRKLPKFKHTVVYFKSKNNMLKE